MLDPIRKMNFLKYSTNTNTKIGSNVKYFLIDLRSVKKPKLESIIKNFEILEVSSMLNKVELEKLIG
jgi:hypothetical protein